MRHHLLLLLLSNLFLLPAAFAGKSQGHSLNQLYAAANVLRVVVDNGTFCDLKVEEAANLIQSLHAMIDQQISKIEKPKNYLKSHARCELNCECGLAADVLEHVSVNKLTKKEKAELSEIQSKAAKMTHEQAVGCAQHNVSFCKSPLLNELRAQNR